MNPLRLERRSSYPEGRVRLPASKSISNRLLILSWLSGKRVRVLGASEAGDTRVLKDVLERMERGERELDLADAGTAMRFVTALAALMPGEWTLKGTERMQERPIGPLVSALQSLEAEIEYMGREGCPPLRIRGGELRGGTCSLRSDVSSQFLSALCLVAPATEEGVGLQLEGEPVSTPYFRMTLSILRDLGVAVEEEGDRVFVPSSSLPSREMRVEADHSAAVFWFELLALSGKGALFLEGLKEDSFQGDRESIAFFRSLGLRESWEEEGCWVEAVPGDEEGSPYEADMRHHPDVVPALAVALAASGRKSVLNGVGTLRSKESDRLEALKSELQKVGVELKAEGERLGIDPSGFDPEARPHFHAHGDHRIAMALAPLVAKLPALSIDDPSVVEKSYPRFWEELERVFPGTLRSEGAP